MSFGYIPHPVPWKNAVSKVVGWPSLLRRMQVPDIMAALDIKPGDKVLDIGCGMGNLAFEMARRGAWVEAVDLEIHPLSRQAARKMKNLEFVVADAQRLPYLAKSFDKILLSSILQVVKNDQRLLQECHRLLRPGGVVVGTVPQNYVIVRWLTGWSKKKIRKEFKIVGRQYYSPRQLKDLVEDNKFRLMEIKYTPRQLGNWLFQLQLSFRIVFGLPYFDLRDFWLYSLGIVDKLWPWVQKGDGEFLFVLKKK